MFHLNQPHYSVFKIPWSTLCRELGHRTTKGPTPFAPADKTYHITALASVNIMVGRFQAFAAHIYVSGAIPQAKYSRFSSTYTVIRWGSREKMVVDIAKPLPFVMSHWVSLSWVCQPQPSPTFGKPVTCFPLGKPI